MAIKIVPGGYDEDTGFSSEDPNAGNWTSDPTEPIDIPNWRNSPYGGHSTNWGPRGTTLTTTPAPAPAPSGGGGGMLKPYINPQTGQPEILGPNGGVTSGNRQIAGPAGGGFPNVLSWLGRGNPYWRGAIAAGGVMTPTPLNTGEFTPAEPNFVRPDAPTGNRGLPPAAPFVPPEHPHTARYPTWPTPPAPAPAVPVGNTPIGGGPGNVMEAPTGQVARQKPNLGRYNPSPFVPVDAPNIDPLRRARLGNPQITALDLSKLFGGNRS